MSKFWFRKQKSTEAKDVEVPAKDEHESVDGTGRKRASLSRKLFSRRRSTTKEGGTTSDCNHGNQTPPSSRTGSVPSEYTAHSPDGASPNGQSGIGVPGAGCDDSDVIAEIQEYHYDDRDDAHATSSGETLNGQVDNKTDHIKREILSTEESYVKKLRTLFEIRNQAVSVISEDVSKQMFPNIQAIYELHHDNLLPALRDRVQTGENGGHIGDVMCRLAPFLKLYTEYVKSFQTASQLVQTWREKSAVFSKLLKTHQSNVRGDLGIAALMIEPVQRVPRYELLLKDYLKTLSVGSGDESDVREALEQVSKAAEHFETMMKRDAQILLLGQLQNSLVGGGNIFNLSRKLVRKVAVYQINPTTNLREECNLYVLSDLLLITRELTGVTGSRRQRTKHLMDLAKIKVNTGKIPSLSPGLTFSTRSMAVEVGFKNAETQSEVKKLLHAQMAESTKRKLTKRGTWSDLNSNKKLSLGDDPPQLVPPHTVSVCMRCGEQFTSPKKKKHCAACGMVVCGKCSWHQVELRHSGSEPQRVCSKCFDVLKQHSPTP